MKALTLKCGTAVLLDDDDFEAISQFSWRIGNWGYACRSRHVPHSLRSTTIVMHRLIMGLKHGDARVVDHIDGDRLNNQKANLRIATATENARNINRKRSNTSGYKGVCWNKDVRKWQSNIRSNGRRIHLGLFTTPEEAYAAYCDAALKYHGKFANLGDTPRAALAKARGEA